ncbi:Mrp/NBP35 family ATP-binding protein [Adlercreutzia sp. ZJ138]|uniref:Mrp/NBP35 family ATP-binding protein n=1 Tax=Adlercreutzia sp. ZJ138 TaxID=2709405 RepID=UPI0013EC5DC7|nr:Mrp/NBP35 family ATP-binding protein [Adlercreutzia sp. ZJ138]
MAEECSHNCSSCGVSGCGDRTDQGPIVAQTRPGTTIKHVIGIVSGKGGVGKSLVTSLVAAELRRRGYSVGILDADVTGPSIPRTFGVTDRLRATVAGLLPSETASGIGIVSTNLMLPEDDAPVAWRGPVVSNCIKQFYEETCWGELDYLLVDMPPGTSDVLLTVFQMLPTEGIVTVSAPQELVAMIVGKAVNLAHHMDVNVIGLVENMAYFVCDECDKKHYIYGEPQGAEVAKHYGIPAYTTLPIDPAFAKLCDEGRVEEYDVKGALDPIIEQIEALGATQADEETAE